MIERKVELPYPRDLNSVADIKKYLEKLHAGLMSWQTALLEVVNDEMGRADQSWSPIECNVRVGDFRITSMFLNSDLDLVVHYEDVAAAAIASYHTIASNPGIGEYRVKSIRLGTNKECLITYDEDAETEASSYATILSNPGSGEYRICSMRLTPTLTMAIVYDEIPQT